MLVFVYMHGVFGQSTCTNLHKKCWYNPGSHVVKSFSCTSVQTCCSACDANTKCVAFTQNFGDKTCYLKDGLEIQIRDGNCTSGGTILPPPPTPPPVPPPKNAKNILMILIDDLRPELGAYGSHVPTPNLDKFAKSALTLTNAYIQYSFCCPSRNSFMTGRRPSKTKVWNFIDHFREDSVGKDWVALPQWFKEHGYFTHGLGKLFHPGNPPNSDPPSWSDPDHVSDGAGQLPVLPSLSKVNKQAKQIDLSDVACLHGEHGGSYCELNSTHGPDDALTENGVKSLNILANYSLSTGRPFFLGVGFHKPHIPWTIPTQFFQQLPSIEDTALPKHERPPLGMPPIAWNKGLGTHALDSYTDTNLAPAHSYSNGSWVNFPHNLTRAMRRAYYAAVIYVDFNIGRVLDALDASGVANNTVVAIMGDHGYNLGELNLWCKMTVFESGTRVPFFLHSPGISEARSKSLVEAVDLFPTLIELATGLPRPKYLDGVSVAPLLTNPSLQIKKAAYSEFVKCYSCCNIPDSEPCSQTGSRCPPKDPTDLHEMANCFHVDRKQIDFIGYSVRTPEWRYTEWLHFNGTKLHGDFSRMVANELYDHRGDDGGKHDWDAFENENVVSDPDHKELVQQLHILLMKGFSPMELKDVK